MKYLSLVSSAVSRIPCYLTNEPSRWSYQTIIDNIIRRTKSFLKLFDRKLDSKYISFKPPKQKIYIRDVKAPYLRFRPFKSYFKPKYFRNATSRWYSNTLASALNRGTSRAIFRGGSGTVFGFTGFVLASKPSLLTEQEELEGLAFEIRESFSKFSINTPNKDASCVPDMQKVSVNDLEFGEFLGKGCNAAVYSARWKNQESPVVPKIKPDTEQEMIISHSEVEQVNVCNSNFNVKQNQLNPLLLVKELSNHNLAVKLMFNYCAESNAFAVFRAMYKEAFPARYNNWITGNFNFGPKTKKPVIPPHPNVIEMYTAFADRMPLLNDAISLYPQALPPRHIRDGAGRNMTLFLVMKRYHCNLKEYLKHYQPSIQTSLLILCQLLEGVAHLLQNNIAHRDLKTDNILVDLSDGLATPVLAITDFGSCSETLQMPYPSEEINRGGNMDLMAPEVITAEAGPASYIDYSRSDLWTVGAIAYELFGKENPFHKNEDTSLNSATYVETELPMLPPEVPLPIQRLIMDMLRKDPKTRPSPSFAATVCQLLLHAPKTLFTESSNKRNYKKIAEWLFLASAKTFLETCGQKEESMSLQLQLRLIFYRRIFFSELLRALHYIEEDYL